MLWFPFQSSKLSGGGGGGSVRKKPRQRDLQITPSGWRRKRSGWRMKTFGYLDHRNPPFSLFTWFFAQVCAFVIFWPLVMRLTSSPAIQTGKINRKSRIKKDVLFYYQNVNSIKQFPSKQLLALHINHNYFFKKKVCLTEMEWLVLIKNVLYFFTVGRSIC